MKTGKITIPDIDFDYKLWKNSIDFQRKQIRTYLIRISELKLDTEKDINFDLLESTEAHLHNLKAHLTELEKAIKLQEELIEAEAEHYPIDRSHDQYEAHETIHYMKKKVDRKFGSVEKDFIQFRI